MYICSEESCRARNDISDASFYGHCTVDAQEQLIDGPTDLECDDCHAYAEYCDVCTRYEYCSDHRGSVGEGYPVSTPFSEDVSWVTKAAKELATT